MPPPPSHADDALRGELRHWLRRNARRAGAIGGAPAIDTRDATAVERARAWQRSLHGAGHLALAGLQAGAPDTATLARRLILQQELARARLPALIGETGLRRVAPLLLRAGSPGQQMRFLPRLATADDLWCIAECAAPEDPSGDAPATLLDDGAVHITSCRRLVSPLARLADWILLRIQVATAGTTRRADTCWLAVPARAAGVRLLSTTGTGGLTTDTDELLLREVRVPSDDQFARFAAGDPAVLALDPEGQILTADPTATRGRLDDLVEFARHKSRAGQRVLRDGRVRQILAALATRVDATESFANLVLDEALAGRPDLGRAGIAARELCRADRDICRCALELAGLPGGLVRPIPTRGTPEPAWAWQHAEAIARLASASPTTANTSSVMSEATHSGSATATADKAPPFSAERAAPSVTSWARAAAATREAS